MRSSDHTRIIFSYEIVMCPRLRCVNKSNRNVKSYDCHIMRSFVIYSHSILESVLVILLLQFEVSWQG